MIISRLFRGDGSTIGISCHNRVIDLRHDEIIVLALKRSMKQRPRIPIEHGTVSIVWRAEYHFIAINRRLL